MAKTKPIKRFVQSTTITLPDGITLPAWAVVEEVAWFRDEAEARRYIATVAAGQSTNNTKIIEDKPAPAAAPLRDAKPGRSEPGFRMTTPEDDRKRIGQLAEHHVIRGGPIDTTIRREDE